MGDGEHRTGEPPSYKYTYGDLENIAKLHYPDCEFLFHWNSRDCISLDKLPYIGNYSALKPNMYIATGFKKWGMSLSNISANIIVDNILGKENNYSGSIGEINNEKIGIYKNNDGKIFAVKPICTHLGCLLSWNDVDKTWDCPCHGSRFNYEGKNIYDPAFKDLETYDLT